MIRSLKDLYGHTILAKDGEIGKVHDFYFDDKHWTVRYLVADTGGWLTGRLVLLSPVALGQPDWGARAFPVSLTRQQIEDSPSADSDLPVSRQHEAELHRYYGWPMYWGGGMGAAGILAMYPELVVEPRPRAEETLAADEETVNREQGDPHLRSTRAVTGYHIQATDGQIGHVEDFLADDGWAIRYVVADTRNWLPGKAGLLSPAWIDQVSWDDRKVYVDLPREKIRHAPEFDASVPVSRQSEEALFDHYGRPGYWSKTPAKRT